MMEVGIVGAGAAIADLGASQRLKAVVQSRSKSKWDHVELSWVLGTVQHDPTHATHTSAARRPG